MASPCRSEGACLSFGAADRSGTGDTSSISCLEVSAVKTMRNLMLTAVGALVCAGAVHAQRVLVDDFVILRNNFGK